MNEKSFFKSVFAQSRQPFLTNTYQASWLDRVC